MNGPGSCLLCGAEGDTRIGLVEWMVPVTATWAAIPVCRDREACKARVSLLDEPWPLREGPRR